MLEDRRDDLAEKIIENWKIFLKNGKDTINIKVYFLPDIEGPASNRQPRVSLVEVGVQHTAYDEATKTTTTVTWPWYEIERVVCEDFTRRF